MNGNISLSASWVSFFSHKSRVATLAWCCISTKRTEQCKKLFEWWIHISNKCGQDSTRNCYLLLTATCLYTHNFIATVSMLAQLADDQMNVPITQELRTAGRKIQVWRLGHNTEAYCCQARKINEKDILTLLRSTNVSPL